MKKANTELEYSKYSAIWFLNDNKEKEWKVIEDNKTWYRKFDTQADAIEYFKNLKKYATLRIQFSNSKKFSKTIMTKLTYDKFVTIENFEKAFLIKEKEQSKKADPKKEVKPVTPKKDNKSTSTKKTKPAAKKNVKKEKPTKEVVEKETTQKPKYEKPQNNFSYTQVLDDILANSKIIAEEEKKFQENKQEDMSESQIIDFSSPKENNSNSNTTLFDLENISSHIDQNFGPSSNESSKVIENNNQNPSEGLTNEDFFQILDEHDIKRDPIEEFVELDSDQKLNENERQELSDKERTIETDLENLVPDEFVNFNYSNENQSKIQGENIEIFKTQQEQKDKNESFVQTNSIFNQNKDTSADEIREILEKDNDILIDKKDLITETKDSKTKNKIGIYIAVIIISSILLIACVAIFILFLLAVI